MKTSKKINSEYSPIISGAAYGMIAGGIAGALVSIVLPSIAGWEIGNAIKKYFELNSIFGYVAKAGSAVLAGCLSGKYLLRPGIEIGGAGGALIGGISGAVYTGVKKIGGSRKGHLNNLIEAAVGNSIYENTTPQNGEKNK